jgi:two-component system, NtrC family, response regulator
MSIASKGPERKLLIVDDDEGLRRQLGWAFADYGVLTAGDRQEALRQVQSQSPPVVTLDLGLPPHPDGPSEGLATLEAIIAHAPGTKVIVVTGQEDRAHALRAVALGAYDFYQKPIDADVLHLIVDRAYNLAKIEAENRRLSDRQGRSPLRGLVTAASSMLNVCQTVERVAPIGVNVCILGESGTGKELLARALHELSPRAARRFVAINCAAIPENLLESELFGHEKGAFTGAVRQVIGKIELADRGTLFLDEIGDMPMPLQGKLLRFLQERRLERVGGREEIAVDVRIVCATHRDMEDLTRNNGFRQDLYFRLKEIELHVPALRERAGDTALLAHHFLHALSAQYGRNLRGFTSEALAAIGAYEWPGNVRELENRMKRAVIMADSDVINVADLDLPLRSGGNGGGAATLREARERAERQALTQALANSDGNVSAAAKALGISRPTLYALMRQYGVRE